ncbi:uncharacterized protein LOC120138308 isoform X1 [Hibiscus syriacus]|uniref:uncharacterized protein LOC120138308 isoform X1 n=1 Tax=Hibiscus syriacus TaxID=106335 RepID=UPI0019204AED|nr:uncharacterized protein LOC120138308 isoform X1 [Hibiscus syriacus]
MFPSSGENPAPDHHAVAVRPPLHTNDTATPTITPAARKVIPPPKQIYLIVISSNSACQSTATEMVAVREMAHPRLEKGLVAIACGREVRHGDGCCRKRVWTGSDPWSGRTLGLEPGHPCGLKNVLSAPAFPGACRHDP